MSRRDDPTPEERDEARRYPIVIAWSDDDQVYIASAPDLNGARIHGTTIEEAARKLNLVILDWLYATRQAGGEIPERPQVENLGFSASRVSVYGLPPLPPGRLLLLHPNLQRPQ